MSERTSTADEGEVPAQPAHALRDRRGQQVVLRLVAAAELDVHLDHVDADAVLLQEETDFGFRRRLREGFVAPR